FSSCSVWPWSAVCGRAGPPGCRASSTVSPRWCEDGDLPPRGAEDSSRGDPGRGQAGRQAARPAGRVARAEGLAAVDVAAADQHAGGAAAAPAAGRSGAAGCLLPAALRGPERGGAVLPGPPGHRPGAEPAAPVRRVLLAVVLCGVPAAVHLPDRLHHPAHPLAREEPRSEEHTSELQSRFDLVCRLLLEKT